MTKITTNNISGFIEVYRKKYRLIPMSKVVINSNTPVGEDAIFLERKPYGGRREFYPIFKVEDSKVVYCHRKFYDWDNSKWVCLVYNALMEFCVLHGIHTPEVVRDTHLIIQNNDNQ